MTYEFTDQELETIQAVINSAGMEAQFERLYARFTDATQVDRLERNYTKILTLRNQSL